MASYVRLGWVSGLSLLLVLCVGAPWRDHSGHAASVDSRERRRHLDDGALADDLGAASGLEIRERREERRPSRLSSNLYCCRRATRCCMSSTGRRSCRCPPARRRSASNRRHFPPTSPCCPSYTTFYPRPRATISRRAPEPAAVERVAVERVRAAVQVVDRDRRLRELDQQVAGGHR